MTNPDGYQNPDSVGAGGDPSGWGSIAALFGGWYDTTVNAQTARKNTDKTIAAQKAEAELAYQRQVEMWHMQNAYNSPMEQMKRFGAAGLNPNLIYGQGSSGTANKFPEYQAPNLQYRYEAPQYGAAAQSAIQQLMQVGTWMQNMKLSEQEIRAKDQSWNFLQGVNPRKLQELENRLSLFGYQESAMRSLNQKSRMAVGDLAREFMHKWGEAPVDEFLGDKIAQPEGYSGIRKLQFLEQLAKTKIAGAKSSWTDLNITDPQALMQLVLGGVMGMAGTTLRLNMKSRNAAPVKEGFKQKWTPPKINRRRRSSGFDSGRDWNYGYSKEY